jgi:hypothetical protein
VKAIHDRYYSTPPATFTELRWRFQHIAEEEIGKHMRNQQASDDAAFAQAMTRARNAG